MSISVLNRGASGGMKPELTVTAPSGSTIDLLQNGIIVDTYVLDASETEHTFAVKVGTYTVRGTLGAQTKSKTVVIDTVGHYTVEIAYYFYSEFDEKEAEWIEEGGAFGYGNGLYIERGSALGTAPCWSGSVGRKLTIPLDMGEKFIVEFSCCVTTATNDDMAHLQLLGFDNNGNQIFSIIRTDGWKAAAQQTLSVATGVNEWQVYSAAPSLNGATIECKYVSNDTSFEFYESFGSKTTNGSKTTGNLAKLQICFSGTTNYPQGAIQLNYLKVMEG